MQRTGPAVLVELSETLPTPASGSPLSSRFAEKAHPNHAGCLPSLLKHPKMLIQFRKSTLMILQSFF